MALLRVDEVAELAALREGIRSLFESHDATGDPGAKAFEMMTHRG